MKFHFCQNDRNEITPAMSFTSGCIMLNSYKKLTRHRNENIISPEMKSHVNSVLNYCFNYQSLRGGFRNPVAFKMEPFETIFRVFQQITNIDTRNFIQVMANDLR